MRSISTGRGPQRRSFVRSRPSARSTACARASSARGARLVSTAMQRLTNGGWSSTPQGAVRYSDERARRRTFSPSQNAAIARSSVSRTSPILPPSATSASAMVLAVAYDGDPDAGKGRCDRRMRLVHADPHPQDLREPVEDGFSDRAGRGLDQSIATRAKRPARDLDDLVVAHGVRELVGTRSRGQIDVEHEIELEGLPDLGLVLHHAVIGVQCKPGDEDGIGHRALPMAAATRRACTVSATSWVRMIAAPPATARTWAAIDPPRR